MGLGTKKAAMPAGVARMLAKASEAAFERFGKPRPEITEVGVELCTRDYFFSNERARADLDYAPLVDTMEGIRRTAVDAARYYHRLTR